MREMIKYKVCIQCMTYNQEAFIEDALKGFVMQETSFPFIAIIIDDFSSDNTASIIQKYERLFPERIKGIYLNENYFSKRKPKDELFYPYSTQSEYIAICEGDDYWTDPLKLQKQVDFLDTHPDYSLCCTAFTQTENGDEQHPVEIAFDYDEIILEDILKGAWIGTLTTLVRNEAIADYTVPFPDLPMGDLPLWCHLAMKGKIKYLRDVTANYRRLQDSASHCTDEEKEYRFRLEAMRVREYYAEKAGIKSMIQSYFSKEAHYILDQCFKNRCLDFPLDKLWHFVETYGHPSGYDELKYWGLRIKILYPVANRFLILKHKIH